MAVEEKLVLGESDLSRYVSRSVEEYEQESQELTREIDARGGINTKGLLAFEKIPFEKILRRKRELAYPELNPEFLGQYWPKRKKEEFPFRPKFGIYPFFGEGNFFKIEGKYVESEGSQKRLSTLPIIANTLARPILEIFAVDFYRNEITQKELDEKYQFYGSWPERKNFFTLTSNFNGLIPLETKQKAEKALELFPKKDIYLIAEVAYDDWESLALQIFPRIALDPIIVGVDQEKCFLIDHFDCTLSERRVLRDYTIRKE